MFRRRLVGRGVVDEPDAIKGAAHKAGVDAVDDAWIETVSLARDRVDAADERLQALVHGVRGRVVSGLQCVLNADRVALGERGRDARTVPVTLLADDEHVLVTWHGERGDVALGERRRARMIVDRDHARIRIEKMQRCALAELHRGRIVRG